MKIFFSSGFQKKLFFTFTYINIYFLLTYICAQEIPDFEYSYTESQHLINQGKNWQNHTTFGPIRFNYLDPIKKPSDSLIVHTNFSIESYLTQSGNGFVLSSYGLIKYKNFYAYSLPLIVTNDKIVPRYSGLPREIDRFGFNSGEVDMSGVGYEDKNFLFQLGRGRQSWGAGENLNLLLSNNSKSYDFFLTGFKYRKIRYKFFYGFLENKNDYQRYISGRGIEYFNEDDLIISLAEVSLYSGQSRSMDFAYLNPISTHLDIDMNGRANKLKTDQGNAAWQISLDWMAKENLRVSANFIIDEFKFDKVELDSGKNHGLAFSFGTNYFPKNFKNKMNLFICYLFVGTNTFRHEDGYNNFVSRNSPLGWHLGSDSDEIHIGIEQFLKNNLRFNIKFGYRRSGYKTLVDNSYTGYGSYVVDNFPSDPVKKYVFSSSRLDIWRLRKGLKISLFTAFDINDKTFDFSLNIRKYFKKMNRY